METYERDDTRVVNIIFMVIMTVLLWPVNCYSYVLSGLFYGIVIRWGQYLAAAVAVLMVFYAKKQNAIFNLNLLLSIILILSTVINNGNINKCLNYVSPMLGTVSLITYYFGIHKDKELLRVVV